jgi:hypothetical protein
MVQVLGGFDFRGDGPSEGSPGAATHRGAHSPALSRLRGEAVAKCLADQPEIEAVIEFGAALFASRITELKMETEKTNNFDYR